MSYLEEHWSLRNKRAVVTGSSKGIGSEVAKALAAVGAEVLVHYNTGKADAQSVVDEIAAAGGEAWSHGADLTSSTEVAALFEAVRGRWGALDILVNNAGSLVQRAHIESIADETLDRIIKTNFHSTVYCIRAALPLLQEADRASIINMSSIAAHNGGADGSTIYASMKGALVSLTHGLAKELAPSIRVNAVAPAAVPTAFLQSNISEERLNHIAEQAPLKRIGRAADTAAAVVFLCGSGASYITGEVLDVSGGRRFAF